MVSGFSGSPGIVVKRNGTPVGRRTAINFITDATITDDTANREVDIDLSSLGSGGGGGTSDHSQLSNLGADDHIQYHNNTRGDARYYPRADMDTMLANKAASSHNHTIDNVTGLQDALSAKAASSSLAAVATTGDYNDLINIPGGVSSQPSLVLYAGRYLCSADTRWVTSADDLYGFNLQNFQENCGTGLDPIVEWEHMGLFVPAGRTLRKLHLIGRVNNAEVTDLEIDIYEKYPNPATRWSSGIDADGEVTTNSIYRDTWMTPTVGDSHTGDIRDMHKRTLTLNHAISQDCFVGIYIKPVGTITANRYFYATNTWEIT